MKNTFKLSENQRFSKSNKFTKFDDIKYFGKSIFEQAYFTLMLSPWLFHFASDLATEMCYISQDILKDYKAKFYETKHISIFFCTYHQS